MMNINQIRLILVALLVAVTAWGQTVPFSNGRIVMSSDGNAHDPDDWGASVASLGIIAAQGLQNRLTLYTYADHVWRSEARHLEQITESAMTGGLKFGFDLSRFISAVEHPDEAYRRMKDEIVRSTSEDPLTIVAAGPMQVVGEALRMAKVERPKSLKFVRVISHSKSNNQHADRPQKNEPPHEGWHWDEMVEAFASSGVLFDLIIDQNDKTSQSIGFSSGSAGENGKADWSVWEFLKDYHHHSRRVNDAIHFIYERMKASKRADISDAGMLYYLFTGDQQGGPEKLKALFDQGFENEQGFKTIFNGKDFDGWYLKIRKEDPELANKVFSIEDGMVHVFNDAFPEEYELEQGNLTHGLFYTLKSYKRFIFRFEYKWGTKIANNFSKWQYDAGCYYHVVNDKVWPKGIEYQVRYNHLTGLNHTGDFFTGAPFTWYADETGTTFVSPKEGGIPFENRRFKNLASAPAVFHALDGEWNTCEVIVMADEYAIHKLNGEVVNMATDLAFSEGIIGLQSETAEVFYRNIEIKEFEETIPADVFLKP